MNILITSFSFPALRDRMYDGRFVLSEAMAYAENGASVRVVTPHYFGADKVEKVHERITVFRFQYFIPKSLQVVKKPGIPIYNQKSLLAILQIPLLCFFFTINILKHAAWAELIHAQWTITALLSLPARWILGTRIVLTARGSDLRLAPKWLNRFIHSKVDGAIDCFGPQPWNREYKRDFQAHYIKLPHLVHNDPSGDIPEDMNRVLQFKSDAFVILYVGRFDYIKINKNKLPLIDLILVSKLLKAKKAKFHVFYAGGGEEEIEKKMRILIDQNGLQDQVTLLGVKTNVPDYIRFSHIGLGGIAFNGVSHEFTINATPQILIDVPDNAHTPWRHGINAIFVRPNDEADLAEKLDWAIRHRKEVREIGKRAREEMSQYITDSHTGGRLYLNAFSDLVQGV
jgi:glycosyltransferase involved in cell wall biosynthesis